MTSTFDIYLPAGQTIQILTKTMFLTISASHLFAARLSSAFLVGANMFAHEGRHAIDQIKAVLNQGIYFVVRLLKVLFSSSVIKNITAMGAGNCTFLFDYTIMVELSPQVEEISCSKR